MYSCDLTAELKKSLDILYPINPDGVMKCVEIGSFEGKGSNLIHTRLCENKDSVLYCIDPFDDEYVKGSSVMAFWNKACDGQYSKFKHNTAHISKIIELKGYSDDMIPKLDDDSMDFCYIDGDHSPEQVYKDIINIYPKMKNNSVVLFDDYLWVHKTVVTKVGVDKFLNEYKGKYELLFSNYQLSIRIKK
jgi:hypothetical protein